jgi:hypothetical protein
VEEYEATHLAPNRSMEGARRILTLSSRKRGSYEKEGAAMQEERGDALSKKEDGER